MTSRVSTAQMFKNVQANVASAREKEIVSSTKAATGKEIVRPSQDPAGWLQASALKDGLSARENMTRNADVANHMLQANETVLSTLHETLQRAYELAISASGSTLNAHDRELVRQEVLGLYENAVTNLNTQYANRYLLSGYSTDRPAFSADGSFQGDNGVIEIEVTKDLKVPLNLSAEKVVYGEGLIGGVNILETLGRLAETLCLDDSIGIQSTLEDFRAGIDQISRARADVGARMSQIREVLGSNEIRSIDDKDAISRIEDADMIKVLSELARDQAVVKAAIMSGQKLLEGAQETVQILFPK